MEKEQFETLANFARLSYTEKMSMAEKTIRTQLGDYCGVYIVDMDDVTCTVYVIDYETYVADYRRYDYVVTDAEFTVSNEQKVYAKYITKAEMDYLEGFGKSQEIEETEEVVEATEIEVTEATEIVEITEVAEEPIIAENVVEMKEDDKDDEEVEEETEEEEFAEPTPEEEKDEEEEEEEFKETEVEEEDDEQDSEELPEEDSNDEKEKASLHNPTTLSDSERNELENYRRKEKIELINSFEGMIDADTLKDFVSKVDEYDHAKLKAELSIIYSDASRTGKVATTQPVTPMSFNNYGKSAAQSESYKDLVARILKK